jgi:hypothetical protein
MPELFTPLVSATPASHDSMFAAIQVKGVASTSAQAAAASPGNNGAGTGACSKPVVTLKRNGATVSGIRVQCGCGQVIDLACVY